MTVKRRLYADGVLELRQTFTFDKKQAHHAVNVLRVKIGDNLEVIDREGNIFNVEVITLSPFMIKVKEKKLVKNKIEVYIFLGLVKYQALEKAVFMVSETGANFIIPVICEKSVLKSISSLKKERLEKIAVEANKQSKVSVLTKIGNPIKFSEVFYVDLIRNSDLRIYCSLEEKSILLNEFLVKERCKNISKICVFVGPEGDFSNDEIDLLKRNGFKPVSLLKGVVYKTENAAFLISAFLRMFFGF